MLKRIYGKLKALSQRVYNMHTYGPEVHYRQLYYPHIRHYLQPPAKVLDIGCQYGRFSIPLLQDGFSVTATDLKKKYLRYVANHAPAGTRPDLRQEDLQTTLATHKAASYDAVLCLELLYNLPGPQENLRQLSRLVKPGGYLLCSHRPLGYYLYRFLREGNPDAIDQIRAHRHSAFNAQTPAELEALYQNAGLELLSVHPIGMFSGYGPDPFARLLHPGKVHPKLLAKLEELENDPELQALFASNARYLLAVAKI